MHSIPCKGDIDYLGHIDMIWVTYDIEINLTFMVVTSVC